MDDIDVGGTPGGLGTFLAGLALSAVAAWFFVDSVRVVSRGGGWFSGWAGGGGAGVIFLPLLVGVIGLFYNSRKIWPWILCGIGIVILFIEILSGLNFFINLKLSHLLIMLVSFAAGIGMILRSVKAMENRDRRPPWQDAIDDLGGDGASRSR